MLSFKKKKKKLFAQDSLIRRNESKTEVSYEHPLPNSKLGAFVPPSPALIPFPLPPTVPTSSREIPDDSMTLEVSTSERGNIRAMRVSQISMHVPWQQNLIGRPGRWKWGL